MAGAHLPVGEKFPGKAQEPGRGAWGGEAGEPGEPGRVEKQLTTAAESVTAAPKLSLKKHFSLRLTSHLLLRLSGEALEQITGQTLTSITCPCLLIYVYIIFY